MTITLLGTGTSTGVPVPGCSCGVCGSTDPRNRRTRCSVLITFEGRNILIDTATDLRQQALRERITHIDAVLYTHAHADHLHGIDDLRPFSAHRSEPIPLFGSPATMKHIRSAFRYIFDEGLDPGYRPNLAIREVTAPFRLEGLPVEPLELFHGQGRSTGYRIGFFAYLTDCNGIPPEAEARLGGLDLLIIDGLRFAPHTTHFNIPQAIEVAGRFRARRTLLTHLSHDVDYARDSQSLPPGIEFATDGQRLSVPGPSAANPLESGADWP